MRSQRPKRGVLVRHGRDVERVPCAPGKHKPLVFASVRVGVKPELQQQVVEGTRDRYAPHARP